MNLDPFIYCYLTQDAPPAAAPPQVTPGLVAQAFRRLPLPASELTVQPPGGETLVNFDTNFFTDSDPFTRTVTLLGRQVRLRIEPSRFGWRFDDGHVQWTAEPGSAYPHLDITHAYREAARVSPRVDTTYSATYSVAGGAWQPVAGTVTIPGASVSLRVREARPELVGSD